MMRMSRRQGGRAEGSFGLMHHAGIAARTADPVYETSPEQMSQKRPLHGTTQGIDEQDMSAARLAACETVTEDI